MDIDIEIDCPECGRSLKVTTAEVARGATKRCPGGHSLTLVDEGGGARKVQASMDALDKKLRNFGR